MVNFSLIIGFFLLTLSLTMIFVLRSFEKKKKAQMRQKKYSLSKADTATQLKVLVSASRITGTHARDEITRQAIKNSVTDLAELSEIKNKIEANLIYIKSVVEAANSYVLPLAAGRASKLHVEGTKVLTVIKERERQALDLAKKNRNASTDIKKLIRSPYIIVNDVFLDLAGTESSSVLQWSGLSDWANTFEAQTKEVRQAINSKVKLA